MKLFLLGKRASITGWLEEAAAAFRAEAHKVEVGIVRNPFFAPELEAALVEPIAARLAARARRFRPDLILAIGGFHVPLPILERLAAWPDRPPLVGWVGDAFAEDVRPKSAIYDRIGYTDTGFLESHRTFGFSGEAVFAPHAADPSTLIPKVERRTRMVFVAGPSPLRRAAVESVARPMTLYGRGWRRTPPHEIHVGRVPRRALAGIYAGHLASLNVRNEFNVLNGLNQRHFQPPLAGTPLVSDDQPDLGLCFELGAEVLVWRNTEELNEIHGRILTRPAEALVIGKAAMRRVLAEHTFGVRLQKLAEGLL